MDYLIAGAEEGVFVVNRHASLQEVRFTKAMTYLLIKLVNASRGKRGSSIDSLIFGRIVYKEYRRGKRWYSSVTFLDREFQYQEMRDGLTLAIKRATGEWTALSISFDRKSAEWQFLNGRPTVEKINVPCSNTGHKNRELVENDSQ